MSLRRHTSGSFRVIAVGYLFFPVLYLLACAFLYEISGRNLLNILLSPGFYFVSFWAVLTGYGFWETRRWGWYVFLFTNILIAYENTYLLVNYGGISSKILWFLLSMVGLSFVTYQVSRELQVPYFMPRIRWWETNSAFQLAIPAVVQLSSGYSMDGTVIDFSLRGCFLKMKDHPMMDEKVTVAFSVFGQKIEARGVTVWRTDSTVTLPKGIGVKFFRMGRQKRKRVRMAQKRVESVLKIYRNTPQDIQEDVFQKILDELQSRRTGAGSGTHT